MAWEHLGINRPHLVYIILGGFTSLFMLCSSVIKERLYIGEATVATICGIIFGPHAANLIDPNDWGNPDQITLEFSRIVLVVQCFAVGVELPKAYMERHWRSVTFLLVPVMTFGWLITSLFIWWMFKARLDWLDSLCIAACVTATDPVLASSVVGKGKFAKRVPKHLRDLLSAESGCNDGMAFPFVYLAVYIIRYKGHPDKVALHWFCYTILYECIFGAFYGVVIGYIARRAIRFAHERELIDRESFLVFYFVLALFCAGSGSLLGMDDLLVGFACGVGFSNDGWFLEKTEESHVSNVIDLLINLAFFVYFGAIIPWAQFNSDVIGTAPWRLVVVGVLVLFFRRIPIMMALKPVIPDIKGWREALFAGHFGPIGVGAIFVAILARAELETESTTPLAVLPPPGFQHLNIIELIWPITTFLVIVSIVVHGSSIAVFTLGRHINTLTLTLSFTQANEEGPSWMDRLPRIQSRSKSQMSSRRQDEFDSEMEEKVPGDLEGGFPRNFLRRQREEDIPSRTSSVKPPFRRKRWDANIGPGGPISQSAITPQSLNRDQADVPPSAQTSDTLNMGSDESPESSLEREKSRTEPPAEIYQEGDQTIFEDQEGNVLEVRDSHGESEEERLRRERREARRLVEKKDIENGVANTEDDQHMDEGHKVAQQVKDSVDSPGKSWRDMRKRMGGLGQLKRRETGVPSTDAPKPRSDRPQVRGAAHAYQFGNTIIVEDQDGEVVKKYDIPSQKKSQRPQRDRAGSSFVDSARTRQRLQRMGTYLGMGQQVAEDDADPSERDAKKSKKTADEDEDDGIRFTVTAGGRRMSKAEFIQQIQRMDPKSRAQLVEDSNAPEAVKQEARADAKEHVANKRRVTQAAIETLPEEMPDSDAGPHVRKVDPDEGRPAGPEGLTLVDSNNEEIPFHSIGDHVARASTGGETAAQRRRRLASPPPEGYAGSSSFSSSSSSSIKGPLNPSTVPRSEGSTARRHVSNLEEGETAAERRRREGALGIRREESNSSEDEEGDGRPGSGMREPPGQSEGGRAPGIRFAEPTPPPPTHQQQQHHGGWGRLRWKDDVGRSRG